MRTYGRVADTNGNLTIWRVVNTDANGFNDAVWLTTLIQVLKLNLQESPFYSNYGLPDVQSIITQVAPDYYVAQTQSQFAPYFANLIIARQPGATPTYLVNVTTHQGASIIVSVAA